MLNVGYPGTMKRMRRFPSDGRLNFSIFMLVPPVKCVSLYLTGDNDGSGSGNHDPSMTTVA